MANETCIECGVVFTIPDVRQAELRRTHELFYCSNGHGQYYPQKSDIEIANEKTAQVKAELASYMSSFEYQKGRAEKAERSNIALRAVITRFENQRRKTNGR
jgi:hypothetical protein